MKFFMAFIILLFSKNLASQNIFHWQWILIKDTLQITGRLGEEEPAVIKLHHTAIKKDFEFLYQTIDAIQYNNWSAYKKTAAALSEIVVKPFEKELVQCNRIVVDMDSSLLKFSLEFLEIQHKALAVFRPMVYTINGSVVKTGPDKIFLHKGLILRDPASDPEDACTTTFLRYPASTFRSTNRLKGTDMEFKTGIDFALISAHGFADSNTLRGCVFAQGNAIKPMVFQHTHLKLIYVDGCQQGINWAYINALAQSSNSAFYLGPVVSNDSGESSTKTINWFFGYLKQVADPVKALWLTKKQLYRHYQPRIQAIDVVNKALIFRIYKL